MHGISLAGGNPGSRNGQQLRKCMECPVRGVPGKLSPQNLENEKALTNLGAPPNP